MRKARDNRKDANQPDIVRALRQTGCTVEILDGKGIPDLLVGKAGINFLMECKTKDGTLTPDQVAFHRDWRGQKAIVRTPLEALRVVNRAIRATQIPARK